MSFRRFRNVDRRNGCPFADLFALNLVEYQEKCEFKWTEAFGEYFFL